MKKMLVLLATGATVVGLLLAGCGAPSGLPQPTEKSAELGEKSGLKPAQPSWQQKWENALTEAKKEGKVVIYGQVGPELREALTQALNRELGLDLELVTGKGSEVATRFLTETQAGIYSADILLGGASTFLTDPKMVGAWDKVEPLLILPEVLDGKAWPEGKLPFVDSQKRLIPLVLQVTQLLLVNTDTVKQGQIKSYKDLLQPQWKGKIVMYDPTIGGTANTWVNLILTKALGPGEGEEYLNKFVGQEPMVTKDSRLQIEWLARGRYPVNVAVDSQAAYSMHDNGAPITRLAAAEGGMMSGGGGYLGYFPQAPASSGYRSGGQLAAQRQGAGNLQQGLRRSRSQAGHSFGGRQPAGLAFAG